VLGTEQIVPSVPAAFDELPVEREGRSG